MKNNKRRLLVAAAAVAVLGAVRLMESDGSSRSLSVSSEGPVSLEEERTSAGTSNDAGNTTPASADEAPEIYVYVSGAVVTPGVYVLSSDARVYEAVLAAGGLTEDADAASVNQAGQLTDGEMIFIPKEGQSAVLGASIIADDRVNINTADESELASLTGIGSVKAQAIISYREEHGAFTDPAQLMNVSGIGESVYAKIREKIKV